MSDAPRMKLDLRRVTFGPGGNEQALAAVGRVALSWWIESGACVFCSARHDGKELRADHETMCPLRKLTRRPE